MREYLKFKRSFTLIELLVVIAVIALLSSVILVSLSGPRQKARITKALEFSQSVQHAIGIEAVGIWDFDDCSAKDRSGYKNDGTINGAICVDDTPYKVLGTGQGKNALSFDGVDDYVNVGTTINPVNNKISVELWFKWTGGSGNRRLPISKYSAPGWYIELTTNNEIRFLTYGIIDGTWTSVSSDMVTVTQGVWYHVVGVWDKPTQYFYVNGVQKTPKSANHDTISNSVTLAIGRDGQNDRFYFNGTIDEVRLYATALTFGQIQDLYLAGLEKHQQLTIK